MPSTRETLLAALHARLLARAFVAEVRSLAHLLGQAVGRTFLAQCDAASGDTRCGVDAEGAAFNGSGTVAQVIRSRVMLAERLATFAPGWFTHGWLEWQTGSNQGRRAEIALHEVAEGFAIVTLLEDPVRMILDGDSFAIRAGFDARIGSCSVKFANAVNFRGFPTIPGQDSVLRYATRDGGHDGGHDGGAL